VSAALVRMIDRCRQRTLGTLAMTSSVCAATGRNKAVTCPSETGMGFVETVLATMLAVDYAQVIPTKQRLMSFLTRWSAQQFDTSKRSGPCADRAPRCTYVSGQAGHVS
jgi:hypothetical protein